MIKKRTIVFAIILFLLAGLLIVYSAWAFVQCHEYIKEAVAAGQLTISDSKYDVVNFYMSNCAQYVMFAVILVALGWIFIQFSSGGVLNVKTAPVPQSKEDEELDEWFEEMEINIQNKANNEEVNKLPEEL